MGGGGVDRWTGAGSLQEVGKKREGGKQDSQGDGNQDKIGHKFAALYNILQ